MSRKDFIVWAAGFFDGEGCVMIQRTSNRGNAVFKLIAAVTQKHEQPLVNFVTLFGGSIQFHKGGWYSWRATGATAAKALKEMRPYLQVKASQVDLVLEFQSLRRQGRTTVEERERRNIRDEEFKGVLAALR